MNTFNWRHLIAKDMLGLFWTDDDHAAYIMETLCSSDQNVDYDISTRTKSFSTSYHSWSATDIWKGQVTIIDVVTYSDVFMDIGRVLGLW